MYKGLSVATHRVVGTKQVVRLVKEKKAKMVFIAEDADEHIRQKIIAVCKQHDIEISFIPSMFELGTYCNIDVAAATAATVI